MSRNFEAGTRDMTSAARILLGRAVFTKELSFGSVGTLSHRFARFADYAKQHGIGRLERINQALLVAYGQSLAEEVLDEEMTASYAQNLVSAVNTTLNIATRHNWISVSPTKDCLIPLRCAIRVIPPTGYQPTSFQAAIDSLREQGLDRQASIAELARELGLRVREASMLNARKALEETIKDGVVTILWGTKGKRRRVLPVSKRSQLRALSTAATVQGKGSNLIPPDEMWKTWRDGGLRTGREALKVLGIEGYHELRASYACARYCELTGNEAPVFGVKIVDKAIDRHARQVISMELGHGRINVVSSYIGGRR